MRLVCQASTQDRAHVTHACGTLQSEDDAVKAGTLSTTTRWRREGLVLGRRADSAWGSVVVGDPCVVWDDDTHAWRMFLFALPPGHGQALCTGDAWRADAWKFSGPLDFANPEAIIGGAAFKPFVVLDPHACGRAARIDGRFRAAARRRPRSEGGTARLGAAAGRPLDRSTSAC
jgi:hypothetical protein